MNEGELENNIKEKFSGFKSEYKASESMWNSIETQLPTENKGRKNWISLFSSLAIILLCTSIIYFSSSSDSVTEKESIAVTTSVEEVFSTKLPAIKHKVSENVKDSLEKAEYSKAPAKDNRPNNNWDNSKSGEEYIADAAKAQVQLIGQSANKKLKNHNELTTALAPSPLVTSIPSINHELLNPLLAQLSSLPNLIHGDVKQSTDKSVSAKQGSLAYIQDKEEDRKFSLGITGGSSTMSSRYQINESAYSSVMEKRQRFEGNKPQYQLGIEVEYEFTTHWFITSGFGLSFFQDELFQESDISRKDTLLNYRMPTTTSQGRDTVLVGTAISETKINTQSRYYTDRLAISLPVVINYKTAIGERSDIGIGLGVEKIFFSKVKGVELDRNGLLYDLTVDTENRYSTRGANALLRLHYNYKIQNNWDLRLILNYKHALKSNYNSSAPIDKSFKAIGVAIGSYIKL